MRTKDLCEDFSAVSMGGGSDRMSDEIEIDIAKFVSRTAWEHASEEDRADIVKYISVALDALVAAEREACCRAMCEMCAMVEPGRTTVLGAIRRVEAAHKAGSGWWHRYWYEGPEVHLSECDARAIRARGGLGPPPDDGAAMRDAYEEAMTVAGMSTDQRERIHDGAGQRVRRR